MDKIVYQKNTAQGNLIFLERVWITLCWEKDDEKEEEKKLLQSFSLRFKSTLPSHFSMSEISKKFRQTTFRFGVRFQRI